MRVELVVRSFETVSCCLPPASLNSTSDGRSPMTFALLLGRHVCRLLSTHFIHAYRLLSRFDCLYGCWISTERLRQKEVLGRETGMVYNVKTTSTTDCQKRDCQQTTNNTLPTPPIPPTTTTVCREWCVRLFWITPLCIATSEAVPFFLVLRKKYLHASHVTLPETLHTTVLAAFFTLALDRHFFLRFACRRNPDSPFPFVVVCEQGQSCACLRYSAPPGSASLQVCRPLTPCPRRARILVTLSVPPVTSSPALAVPSDASTAPSKGGEGAGAERAQGGLQQ